MDYEFLKLLKDKKVADSYQFYDSCKYKLYLAEISLNALQKVVEKYHESESIEVQKVYSDAISTGQGTFKIGSNFVDYLGFEIGVTVIIDKLTIEIMGLLHNFFDTFAQWINSSLLGEKALHIKKASLFNVTNEIQKFPEFTGQFISDFKGLATTSEFIYISDFNNTLKHRYQIYVQNKFDILKTKGDVSIPDFSKDGRVHLKKEALTTIKSDLDFCKNILRDSKQYIEDFYAVRDSNYTGSRMYNPKTYMVFNSREDFKLLRSPQNHYYYLEVDSSNIMTEYQIMLASDRMDGTEDQSIEVYNSVYQVIMLRKTGTSEIIGILKPNDADKFVFNDEHNLIYRKYTPMLSGYESEMFNAIFEDEFHYYPFLSDLEAVVLNQDKQSTSTENDKT